MDPYRILKVNSDAPDEVIRAAYKVLASKYHPDKNPGNTQDARMMQLINDAYALLSDPIRRREYDRGTMSQNDAPSPEPPRSSFEKVMIYCRNCSCAMRVPKEVVSAPKNFSVTCPDCRKDPLAEPIHKQPKPPPEQPKSTINCKHCGQSIRVLSDAILYPDRFEVICPQCKNDPIQGPIKHTYEQRPATKPSIDILRHTQLLLRKLFDTLIHLFTVGLGIAAIFGLILAVSEYFSKNTSNQKPPSTSSSSNNTQVQTPAHPPKFSQPVKNLPQTGDNTASFTNGVAPLTIRTSSAGGNHYFVKITNINSGLEIGSYFIRSGETLNIEVPIGTYQLKYASGKQWYGTNYLFGPDTTYSKAESLFDFSFDGYQYNGYTVELISQRNGNLRTSRLQPGQW